jgi:hypothetical protein
VARLNHKRQRQKSGLDSLYDTIGSLNDPCVYYGLPSDALDHVPPMAYVHSLSDLDEIHGVHLKKHPSCNECNSILRDLLLTTLKDRRKFVKSKLRQRYKKYLNMPDWSPEELAELSESMQVYIRQSQKVTAMIRARLAW